MAEPFREHFPKLGRVLIHVLGSAVILGGQLAVPLGSAAAGSVDVEALTASALSAARVASEEEAQGFGTLMFYDPAQDLAGGVDGAPYGAGDRAWVEAALRVYDLFRQIGGEAGNKRYLFRREAGRVFLGTEGGTGEWHAAVETGQAAFLQLLVRSSRVLPESIRNTVLGDGNRALAAIAGRVTAVLGDADKVLLVAGGGATVVRIEEAWHAVGTTGLDVTAVPAEGGGIEAKVRSRLGEVDGPQAVLAFRDGHRFSPSRTLEVAAGNTAGTTAAAAPPPDPSSNRTTRLDPANPAPVPDAIASGGETRRYAISVPATGGYVIRSTGPSDLVGVLRGADGTVLARDDDGGSGYNFNLAATLEAGEYTLEVTHCCAGSGPFSLTLSSK